MEPTLNNTDTQSFKSPQPVKLSREVIEQLAGEFAEATGFEHGKTSLPELVESLGGAIHYLGWENWQVSDIDFIEILGPSNFSINLLSVDGPLRHNFTIAHELGHYVLHSQLGAIAPIKVGRSGSNPLESEANMFAAALLMPEKPFRDLCKKAKSDLDIAGRFMVSVSAVKVRKKVLGLETEDTLKNDA